MKPNKMYAGVCGLLLSGIFASAANAALVATFSSGSNTVSVNGTLDSSGQNYQINASQISGLGKFTIYGFTASSNSPSAPADGQVPLEKAAAAFVAANSSNSFQTLTINLLDNGFTPSPSSPLAVLTGAASVTFFARPSDSQQSDYMQYTSSANNTSVTSGMVTLNSLATGPVTTVNVAVGPVDFAVTNPYSLGSTITLGLNPGDKATLSFQTDPPAPVALPLPGTSAMLAMGLVSLGGLALLRKKRLA